MCWCSSTRKYSHLVSIKAPFFPREAVSKGLEVWHFGLVFGAFEISVFIVSPIIGANLNRIGVKVRLMDGSMDGSLHILKLFRGL